MAAEPALNASAGGSACRDGLTNPAVPCHTRRQSEDRRIALQTGRVGRRLQVSAQPCRPEEQNRVFLHRRHAWQTIGRRHCEPKALQMAVRNRRSPRRITRLAERLVGAVAVIDG